MESIANINVNTGDGKLLITAMNMDAANASTGGQAQHVITLIHTLTVTKAIQLPSYSYA